jgi:hypothetical protein
MNSPVISFLSPLPIISLARRFHPSVSPLSKVRADRNPLTPGAPRPSPPSINPPRALAKSATYFPPSLTRSCLLPVVPSVAARRSPPSRHPDAPTAVQGHLAPLVPSSSRPPPPLSVSPPLARYPRAAALARHRACHEPAPAPPASGEEHLRTPLCQLSLMPCSVAVIAALVPSSYAGRAPACRRP